MSFSNNSGLPTFLGIWGGKGTPVLFLLLFHLCQTFLLVSCFLLFCLWTSRLTADEKHFRLFYGKMYLFVASLLLQGFSLRLRLLQIAVFLSKERSRDRKTCGSNELFEGILLSAFLGSWMQEVSQSVVCCWQWIEVHQWQWAYGRGAWSPDGGKGGGGQTDTDRQRETGPTHRSGTSSKNCFWLLCPTS